MFSQLHPINEANTRAPIWITDEITERGQKQMPRVSGFGRVGHRALVWQPAKGWPQSPPPPRAWVKASRPRLLPQGTTEGGAAPAVPMHSVQAEGPGGRTHREPLCKGYEWGPLGDEDMRVEPLERRPQRALCSLSTRWGHGAQWEVGSLQSGQESVPEPDRAGALIVRNQPLFSGSRPRPQHFVPIA